MSEAYERLPIAAQNLACSFAGWQRERARFTPHFHRVLKEWEGSVQAPESTLHRIDALLGCRTALEGNVAPLLAVEAALIGLVEG